MGCRSPSILPNAGDGAVVYPLHGSDWRVRWLRDLRNLPPWRRAVYWLASIGALGLVIWDIVDKSAQYTSIVVVVLVLIATVALRAPNRRRGEERVAKNE
jgi:hypothetical protein